MFNYGGEKKHSTSAEAEKKLSVSFGKTKISSDIKHPNVEPEREQ